MRIAVLASGLFVASVLPAAAQLSPQQMSTPAIERSEYGAGNGSHDPSTPSSAIAAERKRLNANDPEGIAEDLRLNGKCDKAVPIFRRLAERGTDYAISQFNLGLCLFDLAKAEHDATQAAALNKEGAQWVLQAANAGFGKAQTMAVVLYLDGLGVAADPVEAGKWAYIFHDNGSRLVLGLPDISADTRSRLDAVLTGDKRREAHARADGWSQTSERTDQ
jgi:TPR repeat protein